MPTNPSNGTPVAMNPAADDMIEKFSRMTEALAGRRYHDLRVEVVDAGTVRLYGHADSYYAKQMAIHVASDVIGWTILEDQLRVLPQPRGEVHPHRSPRPVTSGRGSERDDPYGPTARLPA